MSTTDSAYSKDFAISYPNDAIDVTFPIEEKHCFFIMQYTTASKRFYNAVSKELSKKGIVCVREDECTEHGLVMADVIQKIKSSEYIVADISSRSGNVFYELGLAHCYKKMRNVIIIIKYKTPPIFDLNGYRYISYKSTKPAELAKQLAEIILGDRTQNNLLKQLCNYDIIQPSEREKIKKSILCDFPLDIADINAVFTNPKNVNVQHTVNRLFETSKNYLRKSEFYKARVIFKILAFIIAKEELFLGMSDNDDNNILSTILDSHHNCYKSIPHENADQLQTDFALAYTNTGKISPPVLNWIINYFSRTKSTNIDLNRHRLEEYLIQTKSKPVINAIIDGLASPERHIREHMADVIGTRHLEDARKKLIESLSKENWPYAASAMIVALGKLDSGEDAVKALLNWLNTHENWLLEKCHYFIIKRIANALENLEKSSYNANIVKSKYKNQLAVYDNS